MMIKNPFTSPRSLTRGRSTSRRRTVRTLNPIPQGIRDIAYRICGEDKDRYKLARQFLTLREQFPRMTLPEGLTYIYLKAEDVNFVFQYEAFGGRYIRGGQVPDFMLLDSATVLRVMGDYWHSQHSQRQRDLEDRLALEGATIQGRRVRAVVDVWESKLLSCQRKSVLRLAVQGIEVGR